MPEENARLTEETEEAVVRAARFSKEQKIGFILLLIFVIISLLLGVLQIRNNLYRPFALNNKLPPALKDEVNSIDALRFRDTDNDGINDFEEMYKYQTSPYLSDTDSDGKSDAEEIERGANPLCPEGRDCSEIISPNATSLGASSTLPITTENPGVPPPDLKQILRDPVELRRLLQEAGVDKQILSKMKDAELLGMVDQVFTASTTDGLAPKDSSQNFFATTNTPRPR